MSLRDYLGSQGATAIADLPSEHLKELQQILRDKGFDPVYIDGLYGALTETAFNAAKAALDQGQPGIIGLGSLGLLEALPKSDGKPTKISLAGEKLIHAFESLRLKVYNDGVGVATIGWGHTGRDVYFGMPPITREKADQLFRQDIARFEKAVQKAITKPMLQREFDAMVSLAYNIGEGAFSKSSIARKFNAGDKAGSADAFLLYNKGGGRVLAGLTRRRKAERAMFLGQNYGAFL